MILVRERPFIVSLSSLTTLEEVNRRHKADQERFEADLISSYEEIERIESENPKLSDRFYFVQDTRNYVNDLTDCLTSKVYFLIRSYINHMH